METRYNVTGEKRKEMVEVISGAIGMKAVYMRMPTCAYVISNMTVSKDGTLAWDGRTDSRTVERVKEALAAAGFTAEPETENAETGETAEQKTGNAETGESAEAETENAETGESAEAEMENAETGESAGPETENAETTEAAVSLPMEGMTAVGLKNLIYLVYSKQYLINRAFAGEVFRIPAALAEALGSAEVSDTETFLQVFQKHECKGIGFPDGKITFTLPATDDADMVGAFTHLTAAMAQQAKEQKRIRPDETIEENEKYYMRIWLLRLGFGGKEGKEVRNLLLKNLKGHSAFRTEENKERWKEARRNEREAARQQEQASAEETAEPEQDLAEATAAAVQTEQVNQSFDKGME